VQLFRDDAFVGQAGLLLVLPDALFAWLAETPAIRAIRRPLHRLAAATSWWLWAIAIGAGLGLAALVRLEHPVDVAIAASAVPVGLAVHAHLRGRAPAASIALAHLAAILLWLAADRTTTVAVDYYKFWAGSQRRLGNVETAERAYGRLVEVAPDLELGHYYLGRILTAGGRAEEGVRHLQEAQRRAPDRARAWIEEARHRAAQGQREEAVEKARRATAIEPGNRDARALLDRLLANQAAPAGPAEDDEEP
jgi:tetratricopeptide (TPR) repeat protein